MELKGFQKSVIKDLRTFMTLLSDTESIRKAYKMLWEGKNVPIGDNGMPPYNMTIQGVPQVCVKVPTGGGKTFLAANAIKPIFENMPHIHPKCVVWLVPSDAILQQTVNTLSNSEHPYRQRINTDFCGKVEVYTKEQLLNGQNFNPVSVDENLSIFVLSYDSFRASKKEGRKAYQENGNLASFSDFLDNKSDFLPDADETALIQVIRSLNPLIIVDESHHAVSKLSLEMLTNFNPCFVLELTATPKKGSNLISIVDARSLKKEEMVKLPVIVYNQKNQGDVFMSAIALRHRLEEAAIKEEESGGRYIRPIVLFQAQPKTNDDATTFEKIKKNLLDMGVPSEQIAIKTSEKDEIKNKDLLSKDCPIRYIITVNALKEGWDCPFAYILATVANKSSIVDVEQILGRVLRMPYAHSAKTNQLDISYVITSSSDFYATVDKVVSGLINAGFSRRDHRIAGEEISPSIQQADAEEQFTLYVPEQNENNNNSTDYEDIPEVDTEDIKRRLETVFSEENHSRTIESPETAMIDDMLSIAEKENTMYWENVSQTDEESSTNVPYEVISKMNTYRIKAEFQEEIKELRIPQFMINDGIMRFNESGYELLDREDLREGFTLKDKDTIIDFDSVQSEIAKVDIDQSDDSTPKMFKMYGYESDSVKKWFESKPTEARRKICKDNIIAHISKINAIGDADIREYVGRVMENMNEETLSALEQAPEMYAKKIREKIERLLVEHEAKTFHLWLEQDRILCEPNYRLKDMISPRSHFSSITKSLYEEEENELNDFEKKVVWELSSLENIRWWHRNISRKGFAINGAVTAYPDLIVKTENNHVILVETKGDHLDNPESEAKAKVGSEWATAAGRMYRYYMVFQSKNPGYPGACSYEEFMEIIKKL